MIRAALIGQAIADIPYRVHDWRFNVKSPKEKEAEMVFSDTAQQIAEIDAEIACLQMQNYYLCVQREYSNTIEPRVAVNVIRDRGINRPAQCMLVAHAYMQALDSYPV